MSRWEKKNKDSEDKGTQNSGKKTFRVYGVDSSVTINAFNFTICTHVFCIGKEF